VNLRWVIG